MSAARVYLALIGRYVRFFRHWRRSLHALTGCYSRFFTHWARSFRTLTEIIVPFGSVGPSPSVRYGFALRGFRPLGLPRTHRALRSLHPALPALTPYSTGSGCYRFPQTATPWWGRRFFKLSDANESINSPAVSLVLRCLFSISLASL